MPPKPSLEEQLWRHRNLGKAFYENPATQYQAVDELKKALELAPDSARERVNYGLALLKAGREEEGIAQLVRAQKQDPSIPHTWFNLGIAYKRASRYPEAIEQLEGMAQRVPDEPITHYNLGVLYKLQGDGERAIREFERAAELAPDLAGPQFQLATAYRQAGRAEEGQAAMERFRELKEREAKAPIPEDLEWSYYSEIYDSRDPGLARDEGPPAPVTFTSAELAAGLDGASAGLAVLDADGDGGADLLAWSAQGVRLFIRAAREVERTDLEGLRGVIAVAPGDFDNDGLADLAVATAQGAALWRNLGGRFVPGPALPAGAFAALAWLDYDHDYDLDLVLLGAHPLLLRNNGDGTFSDETAGFPFVAGRPVGATSIDLVADSQGEDLVVAYADRPGVVYRDRLGGRYEARDLPALPPWGGGRAGLETLDFDFDGWTDLAVSGGGDVPVLLLANDRLGGLRKVLSPAGEAPRGPAVFADLEDRGRSDLVAGGRVYRNRGLGDFALRDEPRLPEAAALAAADFDAYGRVDLAAVSADGRLVAAANTSPAGGGWLLVGLEGVKNLKLAPAAEVEVRSGTLYQKKIYRGVPLHFGLGAHPAADTVRITWPNGLIQNETGQAAGTRPTFKEAQRLSGSCPMIYTFDGREFEFITDVLGVAPLGASAGDGEYFPVDHDEYVTIPGAALAAVGGRYEVRIVEELREVAYLDQVQLVALDHPAAVDVFTNEKFKGPPFPEFRLYGASRRIRPVAATDGHGNDVLERLLATDRTYPDGFARDYAGVAELHTLEVDFPPDSAPEGRAVLVLSGWVDWADGSTFLGASQAAGPGLVMPYLEVQDSAGRWVTAVADMGVPAGKPKTIAVDLTGKFLSPSRKVRIVTSACVYWDEIFLSADTAPPPATLTRLAPAAADLHFRGFSRVVIHPRRTQPERFVYADVRPFAMWNPTPGLYTRYGEVADLLGAVDDRLVVMGSGDEVRLLFDASGLPPVAAGWRRDYLLKVDGWAKDADANTAYSQSVEPLPYHGMPAYPYAAPDHFPDDPVHQAWRQETLTRPALRLIRPLTEGLAQAALRR
jgi:FG-GAP-like repeat/ASPIC and UnbV/Tetratricopeptide repeat